MVVNFFLFYNVLIVIVRVKKKLTLKFKILFKNTKLKLQNNKLTISSKLILNYSHNNSVISSLLWFPGFLKIIISKHWLLNKGLLYLKISNLILLVKWINNSNSAGWYTFEVCYIKLLFFSKLKKRYARCNLQLKNIF